jgi:hypothetical protein
MVIDAAATFRCVHRYVATQDGARVVFVCEHCRHRTELLSLCHGILVRTVLAFPPCTSPDRGVAKRRSGA